MQVQMHCEAPRSSGEFVVAVIVAFILEEKRSETLQSGVILCDRSMNSELVSSNNCSYNTDGASGRKTLSRLTAKCHKPNGNKMLHKTMVDIKLKSSLRISPM